MLEVSRADGTTGVEDFVEVPALLDPAYVSRHRRTPESEQFRLIAHPANEHQRYALWIASRGPDVVGRIGACIDDLFNSRNQQRWGWVGFFDCIDDVSVSEALFEAAWSWAADSGMNSCVGPASFTTNDECGVLIEGRKELPNLWTPQSPEHHEGLWSKQWDPGIDLLGWKFAPGTIELTDWHRERMNELLRDKGLTVRDFDQGTLEETAERFWIVWDAAFTETWGWVPMTRHEARQMIQEVWTLLEPGSAFFLERSDGTPLGMIVAIPESLNSRGETGGEPDRFRVFIIGAVPEARRLQYTPLLYGVLHTRSKASGRVIHAEAVWTLANNDAVNNLIGAVGGTRHKTWRLYERHVS